MEIQLNDWQFDDLKKEISKMNIIEIIEKYIVTDKLYSKTCGEFVKSGMDKDIEKECNRLYQEKLVIASKLADKLSGLNSTL